MASKDEGELLKVSFVRSELLYQIPDSVPRFEYALGFCDWPVKKSVVNLPIRLKGNSKHISGSSLSSSGAQMKDVVTAVEKMLVNNYSSRPNGL